MDIKWIENSLKGQGRAATDLPDAGELAKIRQFHSSIPGYKATPLRSLSTLAEWLGVGGIYVKDESARFGLNAFKALGGSYAMGRYLAERLGRGDTVDFSALTTPEVRKRLGDITFFTATDGNHGRGVAWAARLLGQKAVVYMPKGSSATRLANIRSEGATAEITDLNYDDAVRLAAGQASEQGGVLVQDTAWEGYETIPAWIMQGYGTILTEALEQLADLGVDRPSHVILQAGVGSFAGAMVGHLAAKFGEGRPQVAVVEPQEADCLYRSAMAGDGKPRTVGGHMPTIMAGLACGEPNPTAWRILRDYSDAFFSVPDEVTAYGMRLLGNPAGDDPRIISGESGAVPAGLLAILCTRRELAKAGRLFGLGPQSRILLISTEGDTDPAAYRRIVWEGAYPNANLLKD